MLVGVENAGEAGVLASREQLQAGAGDAPNPVERVAGMTTPAQGLLLDALAAGVELGAGHRHDVKRVMPNWHNPFYVEVRIMPMWGGLRLVTAVTASVRSA